ncbi:unnamed protein product [Ectocarpus sp. CCAP 1310/34]|nr:unnamed protein product [Ectocarpus sp. CCAP 1310/34]
MPAEPRFTRLFTELLLRVFMTLIMSLFPRSPNTLSHSRRCFRWANECRRPIGCHIAYFLPPRLHFAVPGADSDGGVDGEGDGDRASDWPMRFPSREDQFLDFVALSKWLLEQLSGWRWPYACCYGCASHRVRQHPPSLSGGAVGTKSPFLSAPTPSPATISPINLAVGPGTAVLELLGWLSHAVLNKVKKTLSRGVGDKEDERRWGGEVHEAKRLTDCSVERGMQDEEGGVVVRPSEGRVGTTKGKPGETIIGSRTRGGNGSIGRHGRSDSTSLKNNTAAGRRRHRVIHLSMNGRYVDGKGNERSGEKASVTVTAAGARGNNNSGCSAGDNARGCRALQPELASMMATTAAVSSVSGYTCCWCSSSGSARCSCCVSQFGSSMDDGHGGGDGGNELEYDEVRNYNHLKLLVTFILCNGLKKPKSNRCGTDPWTDRVEILRKAAAVISSATAGGDSPPQAAPAPAPAPAYSKPSSHGNGYGDGYSRGGGGRESGRQTSHAEDTSSASGISASEDRKDCLESMLVRRRGEVLQHLKAVAAGERRINNLHGGGSTGGGGGSDNLPCFREKALLLRNQERALLEELERRKARVGALTIELRDAEATVDEGEVEVREAAADCSDPTKLYKTKSAIRQLKADVKAIDVIIGAKSATLLGKQQGVQGAGQNWGSNPYGREETHES